MKRASITSVGLGLAILVSTNAASAGCIGPTIMGRCEGQEVPWDTHPLGGQHPEPPAGFEWDWRGTQEYLRQPENFDPFSGHDPHDSHWLRQPQPETHWFLQNDEERDEEHDEDDDE